MNHDLLEMELRDDGMIYLKLEHQKIITSKVTSQEKIILILQNLRNKLVDNINYELHLQDVKVSLTEKQYTDLDCILKINVNPYGSKNG